jgi:hypothetical protein
MRLGVTLLALLLVGCSGGQAPAAKPGQAQDLESAAVERGLVPDPDSRDITGLYARDTDRICIVPARAGYRVGAYVDYSDGIGCSGSGTVSRSGERLQVTLGEGCSFEAGFDGERIRFPGNLPEGCARLCSGRASLAGLDVGRISESAAEGSAMRDAGGRRLCGD